MFGLSKRMFVLLLTSIVSVSNHAKGLSLSNQKCMTQPTSINLHPNEYSQELELHYYHFAVSVDRCAGSCNTLDDVSNRVCVANETEDLNLHIFNMIIEVHKKGRLTKYIS